MRTGCRCENGFVFFVMLLVRHAVHLRGHTLNKYCVTGYGSILIPFSRRLRNNLYCVEWDVKLYYTIPFHFHRFSEGIALSEAFESAHFHQQVAPQFSRRCSQILRKLKKKTVEKVCAPVGANAGFSSYYME